MMNKLINKYSYKKVKYGLIAVTVVLTLLFIVSLVFAIISQINFNTYTTITM
ncbi:hypothetical protein [Latilactobacillus sakei]|uniref:hypothetical protein n=1 Tax=Latilactobacillus sakei TaxID=1599 RepID=UPI0024204758|nr:hypothetical protein [Latilactobacillus sakei]